MLRLTATIMFACAGLALILWGRSHHNGGMEVAGLLCMALAALAWPTGKPEVWDEDELDEG